VEYASITIYDGFGVCGCPRRRYPCSGMISSCTPLEEDSYDPTRQNATYSRCYLTFTWSHDIEDNARRSESYPSPPTLIQFSPLQYLQQVETTPDSSWYAPFSQHRSLLQRKYTFSATEQTVTAANTVPTDPAGRL
jgi:hypothetical protein